MNIYTWLGNVWNLLRIHAKLVLHILGIVTSKLILSQKKGFNAFLYRYSNCSVARTNIRIKTTTANIIINKNNSNKTTEKKKNKVKNKQLKTPKTSTIKNNPYKT